MVHGLAGYVTLVNSYLNMAKRKNWLFVDVPLNPSFKVKYALALLRDSGLISHFELVGSSPRKRRGSQVRVFRIFTGFALSLTDISAVRLNPLNNANRSVKSLSLHRLQALKSKQYGSTYLISTRFGTLPDDMALKRKTGGFILYSLA